MYYIYLCVRFYVCICTCNVYMCVWWRHTAARAVKFTISPSTFVPGVTPSVVMRCEVADSGSSMIQLLLLQISIEDRGTTIPIVTLTPGQPPKVMRTDLEDHLTVSQLDHELYTHHNMRCRPSSVIDNQTYISRCILISMTSM